MFAGILQKRKGFLKFTVFIGVTCGSRFTVHCAGLFLFISCMFEAKLCITHTLLLLHF